MLRRTVTLATAALAVSACSNSTKYVSTWKDPTSAGFQLTHTLAVFMTTDAGMRRMVEDRLASRIPGGVPSYRVLPDNELSQLDSVRSQLATGGYNGAIVMRLVGQTTELNPVYHDFYGYWGYWSSAYDPVYYTTSTYYVVETTVYSLPVDKLVWMGRSQTVDPKNANKLADYSVNFAVNNMKKDGLIR